MKVSLNQVIIALKHVRNLKEKLIEMLSLHHLIIALKHVRNLKEMNAMKGQEQLANKKEDYFNPSSLNHVCCCIKKIC